MKKYFPYRNLFITTLVMLTSALPVLSLEFDTSIDKEIKEKYNTSQLEDTILPNLPKTAPVSTKTTPPKAQLNYNISTPVTITPVAPNEGIKLSQWTTFKVRSNQQISDWTREGSAVSFTTTEAIYKKGVTIPAGAVFRGVITNSHQPQITGNGGLVEIKLTSISYNGKSFSLNGKVTKANHKKIFFNNIKGKRQYWKGVSNRINKGEKFYNKTRNTSHKMQSNPVLAILSPVPVLVGYAGYGVCTVISPITAIWSKGGHVSIPAGSEFELKLRDSIYVK